MSDDETMPLAGRGGGVKKAGSYDDRISLRGAALVFFGALLVFSVASLSARSIFPRGVRGRASSKPEGKLELVFLPDELNQSDTDGRESLPSPQLVSSLLESLDYDDEALHSLSPGMSCTLSSREAPVVDPDMTNRPLYLPHKILQKFPALFPSII